VTLEAGRRCDATCNATHRNPLRTRHLHRMRA